MEALIIIGSILVIVGIIGSIIPALPGPVLGYIGLFFLYFAKPGAVSITALVIFGLAMLALVVIDYAGPILGAKYSGASKKGLVGSIAGMILGIIFFPPLGIFIGAFLGALVGELADGKEVPKAMKAGIGTILGSVAVMLLQTIFSIVLAIYFFINLFG